MGKLTRVRQPTRARVQAILTISVYRGLVHIGTDTDGCAYTPHVDGQSPLVEFFEGGAVLIPEQVGHTLKTPAQARLFAETLENLKRAGITSALCGYGFGDASELAQAVHHLRRCAEAAEAYAEGSGPC